MVRDSALKKHIDRSYYEKLANDAIDAISQYGDYESFSSDDDDIPWPMDDELPF